MMIPETKKRLEAVYNDLRSYLVGAVEREQSMASLHIVRGLGIRGQRQRGARTPAKHPVPGSSRCAGMPHSTCGTAHRAVQSLADQLLRCLRGHSHRRLARLPTDGEWGGHPGGQRGPGGGKGGAGCRRSHVQGVTGVGGVGRTKGVGGPKSVRIRIQ